MAKPRVFVSFDYDNDEGLKHLLVGQAKNPDSPFELADWSVKEPIPGDWKADVRTRIRRTDQVIVICGEYTDSTRGVNAELKIAQEEGKPYFLLWGYSGKICKKPKEAYHYDEIYEWKWETLKRLIGGSR